MSREYWVAYNSYITMLYIFDISRCQTGISGLYHNQGKPGSYLIGSISYKLAFTLNLLAYSFVCNTEAVLYCWWIPEVFAYWVASIVQACFLCIQTKLYRNSLGKIIRVDIQVVNQYQYTQSLYQSLRIAGRHQGQFAGWLTSIVCIDIVV